MKFKMMFICSNALNFILNLSDRYKRSFTRSLIYEKTGKKAAGNSISYLGHKIEDISNTF